MTDAVNLVERVSFRDSDHTYHLEGKRIPSVTTILGNLSKPGLPQWAANMGAKAVQARIDELDAAELMDWDGERLEQFGAELHDIARSAHYKIAGRAADKGTVVHDAIQQYHENFFDAEPPDAEVDPLARAAWDAFIAWWSSAGLSVVSTERKIVDPAGRYAGRLDMLCENDAGDLFVCDIKTSNGIYVTHVMQNAAYAKAIEGELEREVESTIVLWLPAGCTKATAIERDSEEWNLDFEMFEMLLRVHGYRKGVSKWLDDIKTTYGPIPF